MSPRRWICLSCLLLCFSVRAWGQPADAGREAALDSGIEAIGTGTPEQAIANFRPLFEADPAFYVPTRGSAAYWLGRAYQATGDSARANTTWRTGFQALLDDDLVDLRLNDAYVTAVFEQEQTAEYSVAAEIYLHLLGEAEWFEDETEKRIALRHLAQVSSLFPQHEHHRLFENPGTAPEDLRLTDGVSTFLPAWWRSQDPLPTTQRNERLEEHLMRVARATRHYTYGPALTGYDDRGDLLVRLGEPSKQAIIRYDDLRLRDLLADPTADRILLFENDFPANEVWYYPRLDRTGLYVFIKRGDRYQHASTTDLLPLRLRREGPRRAPLKTVATIQYLNRALGEINPVYTNRYAGGVDDFLITRTGGRWTMDTSFLPLHTSLESYLETAIREIETDDVYQENERDAQLPRQASQVFYDYEELPVYFRHARLLDADGTTRTELFWMHPPGTFASEHGLVNVVAAQKTADYQTRRLNSMPYLPTEAEQEGEALIVHTLTVRGDDDQYHLRLQWDQHDLQADTLSTLTATDTLYLGTAARRLNVMKVDSLEALTTDPTRLEMSDLIPTLDVLPARGLPPGIQALPITPYPLHVLTPALSLGLYFELYHLTYGPDERTHYTVSYDIERREEGGLWQLFRDQTERTSASTPSTGISRNTQEYVVLDLFDLEENGNEAAVRVTVRVRDEHTGQEVLRRIVFELPGG